MKKSSGSRSRKQRLTAVGTRCADHVTPIYPQKLALTSPTGGGCSVGIVRVRTKATEFSLVFGWAPGPVWTDGKSRPNRYFIPDLPGSSSVAIPTGLPGPRKSVCN